MKPYFAKTSFSNKGKGLIGIIVVLLVVFLLASGLYYFLTRRISETPKIPTDHKEEITQNKVWYIIKPGPEDVREYQIEISPNSNVHSLLEELAAMEDFKIETAHYPGTGVFVESIDGFKGGTDNKWWQYWVNGKLGEVASDRKKVEGNDLIEWRFETLSEFW